MWSIDESVCGVNSVMTAGELDVCGCDSLVSDAAGDSSGVEVVVSSDNAVGGWLSVVSDTLMCGAGVARSDRGDTEEVVEPGVAQPGWVDGFIYAQEVPCGPSHHRCTRCVCVICYRHVLLLGTWR